MKRLLILVPCLVLSACVYNQHSYQHNQGSSISQQQVALVDVGKTTKQWILTNFGIPDRSQIDKDGLEVFEYIHEQTEKSEKNVIFLFNIESEKEVAHKVTRVVMRNGIVESVINNDM